MVQILATIPLYNLILCNILYVNYVKKKCFVFLFVIESKVDFYKKKFKKRICPY